VRFEEGEAEEGTVSGVIETSQQTFCQSFAFGSKQAYQRTGNPAVYHREPVLDSASDLDERASERIEVRSSGGVDKHPLLPCVTKTPSNLLLDRPKTSDHDSTELALTLPG
jgi:hypothetical protein